MNARAPSIPAPRARVQAAFTVLELAIAVTILTAGSAVLWYGLRSASKMDRLNTLHHAAALLARSDLENLRGLPKQDIHDTLYLASGGSGESLLVVRTVMDSSRIVNSLPEIELDENLSPKEIRKPLEVKVKVWRLPNKGDGTVPDASGLKDPETEPPAAGIGEDEDRPRGLAAFIVKLPEYKWY